MYALRASPGLPGAVYGEMMMNNWETILAGMAAEQQVAATSRGNTVVSAGAGSGKTRVLAVRYLYLVKERGLHPSRIACLTFTNKASAEMQERIRGMLETCAKDDQVFSDALAAFPQSCVTTLDALCSEIARNASTFWGIPPDFTVDQKLTREETSSVALEYLLRRRSEQVPARFIAANGFEGSVEALCSLASGRDGLLGPVDQAFDPEVQDKRLYMALEALHLDVSSELEAGKGLDSGTAKVSKDWVDLAEAWSQDLPDFLDPEQLTRLGSRYRVLASLRKPTGKSDAALYFNGACDGIRQKAAAVLSGCQALSDPARSTALAFAKDFILAAREKRTASGTLQFQDVAAMARQALLHDGDLRSWYKARFDAIMVDEFQDDNELQKDILYLLAQRRDLPPSNECKLPTAKELEPGVLFFVGDEKQSIYRFRNADVKVFRGLAEELYSSQNPSNSGHEVGTKPACLKLSTNWRSEPELIEFFNQTFSRIMPLPEDESARNYEARFAGLLPGPATPGVSAQVTWLEALQTAPGASQDDEASLDILEAQAWQLAQLIRELVDSAMPVSSKGSLGKQAKACRYEDIAILFRSTAAQNTYERFLRLFGIPYTATATAGLYTESILGDLYAILRLTAFPDDRLALASVLRGPFAQLADDSCFTILERSRDHGLRLEDPGLLAGLEKADLVRAQTLLATYSWLRRCADRLSLAELVSTLWHERGLRWNVLRNPDNTAYLEHFDFVWSLACDADKRGLKLCDFIADLEPLIGQVRKTEDVPVVRESARGVAVMTIHASKGLEFPVVIIPGADNIGMNNRQEAIVMNERFGPSLRLMDASGQTSDPVFKFEKQLDAMARTFDGTVMDEELAETIRLFYVACTRAVSRLYFCAKTPTRDDSAGRSFRSLFLHAWPQAETALYGSATSDPLNIAEPEEKLPQWLAVAPVPRRTVADYARLTNADPLRTGSATQAARRLAEAPVAAMPSRRSRWAVTAAAENIVIRGTTASQQSRDPVEKNRLVAEGFGEDSFGTLCHELTEQLLLFPGSRPEPSAGTLRKLDRLATTAKEGILSEALGLAHAFVHSPRGLAAAAARNEQAAGKTGAVFNLEFGFTWQGRSDGLPVFLSGSMDLVYGDEHGVYVIDFKTDQLVQPEHHAFQLAVYRESAEAIFGVPAIALLYYLRSGEEREIDLVPEQDLMLAMKPVPVPIGHFGVNEPSNLC
jgi:ATP-dependent exoDNAse (exonuclease V) beta subunit